MSTEYLGNATTPDLRSMTLEERVRRLENDLAERERRTAERQMWIYWYSRSALTGIAVVLVVFLALSLA